jgi:hypothetical protein
MVQEPHGDNGVLRRYLLGSVPDGEREELEQALLRDEDLYEELLATEDELVDEYVRDGLPESQRAGFLQYLSALPDYRQKLGFAEALLSHRLANDAPAVDEVPRPGGGRAFQARIPVLALVAASLLVMLGGVWVSLTISGLREQVGRTQSELARLQERAEDSKAGPTSRPAARSFLLTAGTFRSGGARQVVLIPGEPELLELRLDLGSADYPTYRAAVHDANAVELVSVGQLRARTEADRLLVVFNASSDWFAPGDYYISLMGERVDGDPETVARYDFRVASE